MKVLLALAVLTVFSFSEEVKNVSVMKFEGKGVSDSEAESVADLFSVGLVKSGTYKVLDRANMKKILEEQAFQASGCTDSECAVEIGKLLNMDYMFNGNLLKLGEQMFITANMVSVESGEIIRSEESQGFTFATVKQEIDDLVEKFSGIKVKSSKPKKKNPARKKFKTYSTILFSAMGVTALSCISGGVLKNSGDKIYENDYISSYDSSTAQSLGDSMDKKYNAANFFFVTAEAGIALTTVFGILTMVEGIRLKKASAKGTTSLEQGLALIPGGMIYEVTVRF